MREVNLNVDYAFEFVPEIQEDLDARPQDKDVKKVKGTQPKKYYKTLSKDVKRKAQTTLKIKIHQKMIIDQLKATKVLRLNQVFIQLNLRRCMVRYMRLATPEYTKHTIDMTLTNHLNQKTLLKKSKAILDREREKPTEKDVKECYYRGPQ